MKKKQLEQLLSDLMEKDHEIKRQQKYIDYLADQLMDYSIDNMDLLSRVNDLDQECDKLTGERFNVSAGEHAAAIRIKNYVKQGACEATCINCDYHYNTDGDCKELVHNDMLALADAIIRWWDNA